MCAIEKNRLASICYNNDQLRRSDQLPKNVTSRLTQLKAQHTGLDLSLPNTQIPSPPTNQPSQPHCFATPITPITTCEIIVTVLNTSSPTSPSFTPVKTAKSLAARSGCHRKACLRKTRRLTTPSPGRQRKKALTSSSQQEVKEPVFVGQIWVVRMSVLSPPTEVMVLLGLGVRSAQADS
jgi:hypothetical protein